MGLLGQIGSDLVVLAAVGHQLELPLRIRLGQTNLIRRLYHHQLLYPPERDVCHADAFCSVLPFEQACKILCITNRVGFLSLVVLVQGPFVLVLGEVVLYHPHILTRYLMQPTNLS